MLRLVPAEDKDAPSADRIELKEGRPIEEGEGPVLSVELTGAEFIPSPDSDGFCLTGLPDGVTIAAELIDSRTVLILLSGTPAAETAEADLSLVISKDQLQTPPSRDITASGSVKIVVTASRSMTPVILICLGAAGAAVLLGILVYSMRRRRAPMVQSLPERYPSTERVVPLPDQSRREIRPAAPAPAPAPAPVPAQSPSPVNVAKLHNIGRRSAQQDSLGVADLDDGVLAVVADGMGGLSGGDQVSQSVVMSVLRQAASLRPGQMDGVLSAVIQRTNDEVNRQLGPDGIYRSGSTVVAVLVRGDFFHWISVGDSRIYLYRGGSMLQLNQEHTYEVELMQRVMNGELTQADVDNDPQKRSLTSFIGMGKLKYVDASMRKIKLQAGDRLLLMTDGVFNRLPESIMSDILNRERDIQQAAKVLEEQVLALQDPAQDNFSAILLAF